MIPIFEMEDGVYGVRILVGEEGREQSLAALIDTGSEDLFFGVRNFWASVPFSLEMDEHYVELDEQCYDLNFPPPSSDVTPLHYRLCRRCSWARNLYGAQSLLLRLLWYNLLFSCHCQAFQFV
jgi:hypothetical protein